MRRRQRAPDSMYGRCIYIYMMNKDLNDSLNIYIIYIVKCTCCLCEFAAAIYLHEFMLQPCWAQHIHGVCPADCLRQA